MPASLINTVARVGTRAIQVAKSTPSIQAGSRQTSWMAFEQPNPAKFTPPPVGPLCRREDHPTLDSSANPTEQPPNTSDIIDTLTKQQQLLEWLIFASESEIKRKTNLLKLKQGTAGTKPAATAAAKAVLPTAHPQALHPRSPGHLWMPSQSPPRPETRDGGRRGACAGAGLDL